MSTESSEPQNWEEQTMNALYTAVMQRMIITYMINELLKTGVKTPMKTGVLDHLKQRQQQANDRIRFLVRDVDRQ